MYDSIKSPSLPSKPTRAEKYGFQFSRLGRDEVAAEVWFCLSGNDWILWNGTKRTGAVEQRLFEFTGGWWYIDLLRDFDGLVPLVASLESFEFRDALNANIKRLVALLVQLNNVTNL